ncbi:MAG: nuclear transport factor 2 family protein [Pyrinomonadaceae bacterium]
MMESDAEEFVKKFVGAWETRDSDRFLAIWHPDGKLRSPFYNREVLGIEIGRLNELLKSQIPDLMWKLIDWTWRGNVVVIEWENANRYGEKTVTWRGVDKLTLRDGKIIEEIVYADTAPVHALRTGQPFEALVKLSESLT